MDRRFDGRTILTGEETAISNVRGQTQLCEEGEERQDKTADGRRIYCEPRRQQCDEWPGIS